MRYLLLLPVLLFASCAALKSPNTTAVVDIAATYGIAKHLAGAKTPEQFKSRQNDLATLGLVLETLNSGSADPVAVRAAIASRFGNKPEVLLLANIILTYLQPEGPASEPRNELVSRVVLALKAASEQPIPAF